MRTGLREPAPVPTRPPYRTRPAVPTRSVRRRRHAATRASRRSRLLCHLSNELHEPPLQPLSRHPPSRPDPVPSPTPRCRRCRADRRGRCRTSGGTASLSARTAAVPPPPVRPADTAATRGTHVCAAAPAGAGATAPRRPPSPRAAPPPPPRPARRTPAAWAAPLQPRQRGQCRGVLLEHRAAVAVPPHPGLVHERLWAPPQRRPWTVRPATCRTTRTHSSASPAISLSPRPKRDVVSHNLRTVEVHERVTLPCCLHHLHQFVPLRQDVSRVPQRQLQHQRPERLLQGPHLARRRQPRLAGRMHRAQPAHRSQRIHSRAARMCHRVQRHHRSSRSALAQQRSATCCAIVPVGKNTADGNPSSSATRRSSSATTPVPVQVDGLGQVVHLLRVAHQLRQPLPQRPLTRSPRQRPAGAPPRHQPAPLLPVAWAITTAFLLPVASAFTMSFLLPVASALTTSPCSASPCPAAPRRASSSRPPPGRTSCSGFEPSAIAPVMRGSSPCCFHRGARLSDRVPLPVDSAEGARNAGVA